MTSNLCNFKKTTGRIDPNDLLLNQEISRKGKRNGIDLFLPNDRWLVDFDYSWDILKGDWTQNLPKFANYLEKLWNQVLTFLKWVLREVLTTYHLSNYTLFQNFVHHEKYHQFKITSIASRDYSYIISLSSLNRIILFKLNTSIMTSKAFGTLMWKGLSSWRRGSAIT